MLYLDHFKEWKCLFEIHQTVLNIVDNHKTFRSTHVNCRNFYYNYIYEPKLYYQTYVQIFILPYMTHIVYYYVFCRCHVFKKL